MSIRLPVPPIVSASGRSGPKTSRIYAASDPTAQTGALVPVATHDDNCNFKAAVDDVCFLSARLKKLRLEEATAKKMIMNTKRKTEQLLRTRETALQQYEDQQKYHAEMQANAERERELIALERERQAQSIWASRARMQLERKENVLKVQRERQMNRCYINIEKEDTRDRYLRQRESIRSMESSVRKRREQELQKRVTELRRRAEERAQAREAERQRNVEAAAKMVTEQVKLLYRLQKMEGEKQKCFGELADVVESSTRPSRVGSAAGNDPSPRRIEAGPRGPRPPPPQASTPRGRSTTRY